jgi:hypothetical protein
MAQVKAVDLKIIDMAWEKPRLLQHLDDVLTKFRQDPAKFEHRRWLMDLKDGLRLTYPGMGAKLSVSHQAIQQIEKREDEGKVTLGQMHRFAEEIDCRFVYGFVPKEQPTFSRLITHKALQFVQKHPPQIQKSWFHKERYYGTKIASHLSRPTGWWQLWGFEKALKRKHYNDLMLGVRYFLLKP